jgi:hypothetical protein
MMKSELRHFDYNDTALPKTSVSKRAMTHVLNTLCKARLYRLFDKLARR